MARRLWGLLRRERETPSLPPINVKRVYRVLLDHNSLLARRIKQPAVQRRHEGRISVTTSDTAGVRMVLSSIATTVRS